MFISNMKISRIHIDVRIISEKVPGSIFYVGIISEKVARSMFRFISNLKSEKAVGSILMFILYLRKWQEHSARKENLAE